MLGVSGDVPVDRGARHAERLFGNLPRDRAEERSEADVPPSAKERRWVVERSAPPAQIVVGFLGPRLLDADYPAVKVLVAVMGGGQAGRLLREIRERRGLAYSVSAQNPSRRAPSAIVSYLGTEAVNIEAAESALRQEIDRLRHEPPTADELVRAKTGVTAVDVTAAATRYLVHPTTVVLKPIR